MLIPISMTCTLVAFEEHRRDNIFLFAVCLRSDIGCSHCQLRGNTMRGVAQYILVPEIILFGRISRTDRLNARAHLAGGLEDASCGGSPSR